MSTESCDTMKKTLTTLSLILGLALCATAQNGGGLFQRGAVSDEVYFNNYNTRDGGLILPGGHGLPDDADAPLGSGIAVLVGLGAAYALGKKRKEE